MRHEMLMLGIVGCIAAPLALAQDRGAATASLGSDAQSHVVVDKSHKPLSPIGRAMADLLRAAAQTPAVAPPRKAGDPTATPKHGTAATGHVIATDGVQVDKVALH